MTRRTPAPVPATAMGEKPAPVHDRRAERIARLARELRANLRKRKTLAKTRSDRPPRPAPRAG